MESSFKNGDRVRVIQNGRTGVVIGDPVQGTGGQVRVQVKLDGEEASTLFPESALEAT
jgi:hypothetical protein